MERKSRGFLRKPLISVIPLCLAAAAALYLLSAPESPAEEAAVPPEVTVSPAAPLSTPAPEPSDEDAEKLVISEVMFKNKSTLCASDGCFPDWIELYNRSEETVSLAGWSLSDEAEPGWCFPDMTIGPGEYLLVFAAGKNADLKELHTDFALGCDETVYLFNRHGCLADSLVCASEETDVSTIHGEDGPAACALSTPLFENTAAGYDDFNRTRETPDGLIINEVMSRNTKYKKLAGEYFDLIELKNNSSAPIELSDYALSDTENDRLLCPLPDMKLAAGKTCLVYCCEDDTLDNVSQPHVNFALSSKGESLYLSRGDGSLADYVRLCALPLDSSLGRSPEQDGWYYFTQPTPGEKNGKTTYSRISAAPTAAEPDGEFNDVRSVSVLLHGEGKLYYTLDGSLPTEKSAEYKEPLSLKETAVVRVMAVEEGCAPSEVLTLSYIINEYHELPILSVVADNYGSFRNIWVSGRKQVEVPGNVTLYQKDGTGFSHGCGIHMMGWTSLKGEKKSIGVTFGSEYGGKLQYDVFRNGIGVYSSLSIRGGQDYPLAVIRDELFQSLCADMSDSVLTQESQYCVLYVNGIYYGLYCLKEDITRQYYASHTGVSKDSVEQQKSPVSAGNDLWTEVIAYARTNDLSDPEAYEYICSRMDMDSLIDWFIMEGYACNTDLNGNLRYFRSGENGNRWQLAFYDLDWTFNHADICFYNVTDIRNDVQIGSLLRGLLKNDEFADALLSRYAQVSATVLSNENVLARIDELAAMVDSEIARDRELYGSSYRSWQKNVNKLRSFIEDNDYDRYTAAALCRLCGVDDAVREAYFGF